MHYTFTIMATKKRSNLGRRFTIYLGLSITAVMATSSAFLSFEVFNIGSKVSRDFATLYTSDLANIAETQLARDIVLAQKSASNRSIVRWLRDPDNPTHILEVREEINNFLPLFSSQNFFIGLEDGFEFRSWQGRIGPTLGAPLGILDPNIPEDYWYFKTRELPGAYYLNTDQDRFLGTMRVWVNVPVRYEDRLLGIVGTGIVLDRLVAMLEASNQSRAIRSILVDRHGAVVLSPDRERILQNNFDSDPPLAQSIFAYHDHPDFRQNFAQWAAEDNPPPLVHTQGSLNKMAVATRIPGTEWSVASFFSTSSMYGTQELRILGLISVTMILGAMLLLGFLFRQTFLVPFRALVQSLEQADQPERPEIAGLQRTDELGDLARAIKDLTRRMVESVPVGLFMLQNNGDFLYGNPHFLRQFGFETTRDFSNAYTDSFRPFLEDDKSYHSIRHFLRTDSRQLVMETRFRRADGSSFSAEFHLRRVLGEGGVERIEGILINIQKQKDTEQRLLDLAVTDPLTGLNNRHYLEQVLPTELNRADRRGSPTSLLIADLDHFKLVNDLHGHDIGDAVLIQTATIMRDLVRQGDAVVRWGGEEFAIILHDTDLDGATRVAEKIRIRIAAHPFPGSGSITASFGVAQRVVLEPWADWFKRADQALFLAKDHGRNRVAHNQETRSSGVGIPLISLVWLPELESGNPDMDREHRDLFELANQLLDAAVANENREVLIAHFTTLADDLIAHMNHEEAFLAAIPVPPGLQEIHHRAHERLRGFCTSLTQRLEAGQEAPLQLVIDLINEVVVRHLRHEDRAWFPFTRGTIDPLDPDSPAVS